MMRTIHRTFSLTALVLLLVLAVSLPLYGEKGGNGGGGGKPPKDDPPPPAQVSYLLTFPGTLGGEESEAYDINETGQVVGWAHDEFGQLRAFLWTEDTGMMDINLLADVPDGWIAYVAYGINNVGQIAGKALDIDGRTAIFVYDDWANPPTVEILTEAPEPAGRFNINDQSEIAAVWEDPDTGIRHAFLVTADAGGQIVDLETVSTRDLLINETSVILSQNDNWRYTLGVGWEVFADGRFGGLNDVGQFVGWKPNGNGNGGRRSLVRYSDAGGEEILAESPDGWFVRGINDSGDFVFRKQGGGLKLMLHTDEHGAILIDDVLDGSDADVALWLAAVSQFPGKINERDTSGFPQLAGHCRLGEFFAAYSQAYVLTPVATGD